MTLIFCFKIYVVQVPVLRGKHLVSSERSVSLAVSKSFPIVSIRFRIVKECPIFRETNPIARDLSRSLQLWFADRGDLMTFFGYGSLTVEI